MEPVGIAFLGIEWRDTLEDMRNIGTAATLRSRDWGYRSAWESVAPTSEPSRCLYSAVPCRCLYSAVWVRIRARAIFIQDRLVFVSSMWCKTFLFLWLQWSRKIIIQIPRFKKIIPTCPRIWKERSWMVDKGCSAVTKRVIIIACEHPGRMIMFVSQWLRYQCTVGRTIIAFFPSKHTFVSVWYLAHFTVGSSSPAIKISVGF